VWFEDVKKGGSTEEEVMEDFVNPFEFDDLVREKEKFGDGCLEGVGGRRLKQMCQKESVN
jgi:hypothetical protein